MVEEIQGLYVDEFHCEQNFMNYWYPRTEELDIPQPKTYIFDLEDGEPDYRAIQTAMEDNEWQQVFIRGDGFSDKINPRTGSMIWEPEIDEIRRTFETLKNHLINHMDTPLGEVVAVREWIDLDYCSQDHGDHWHPTELRFFVEAGTIRYVSPSLQSLVEINLAHECTYDYLQERFEDADLSEPIEHALTVANEFTEYAWHADFCLDTNLDWYFIDMGLDGVYWHKEKEEWTTMCGHNESVEKQMEMKAEEVLQRPI